MRERTFAALALLIGIIGLTVAVPATAAAATHGASALVQTTDEEGPFIRGRLIDETDPENPEPVEGVEVTVSEPSGAEIGTATSNAQGEFAIAVPGSGDYVVTVDTDTLPEGTTLRNPEQVENTVSIIGFDTTVQFPIGPDNRDVSGLGEEIVGLVTNGILFGVLLALASLGLSMIYGTTGLTNFSHGELVTFGAVVTYLLNRAGLPVIVAGIIAVVLGGVFGYLQDLGLWRQLRRRGTGLVAMMIVAIGAAILLRGVYLYVVGGNRYAYDAFVTQKPWVFGWIQLTPRDFAIIVVSVVALLIATTALRYTRAGKAMRAVADNPALSASSGINVNGIIALVWTGGATLAALAGMLYTLKFQLDYEMGLRLLLLLFAAVLLGGLGTIWGSILGGLIVGLFTELSTLIIPVELKYVGALSLLIVILLVRPQGILNKAQRVG